MTEGSAQRMEYLLQIERETLADLSDSDRRTSEIMAEIYEPKRERIERWADSCKQRCLLGDSEIPDMKLISSYMTKKMREARISQGSIDYIRRILPEEMKREYSRFEEEQIDLKHGTGLMFTSDFSKPVAVLTRQEVQNEAKILDEQAKRIRERQRDVISRAESENIALEIAIPEKQVNTSKGESQETLLSDALQSLITKFVKIKEKVIEFPPNPVDAKIWARNIEDFSAIFDGYIDEKYTKSIPAWFQVQITNARHGKHAAAVQHGIMLPDGSKRNLTREQVGDSSEHILMTAKKAIESFPGLAALIAWHEKYLEPRIAARKAQVAPKLSERA